MGFMYSWSNIKRVLFSVAKYKAGVHVHIYTYNKQSQHQSLFWVVSMTSVHLETSQNAATVHFHTVHVHSYLYSHRISILFGLGTPLIVLFLCAISPLSSQGAKTRTARDMANSAAIATFHKNVRLA